MAKLCPEPATVRAQGFRILESLSLARIVIASAPTPARPPSRGRVVDGPGNPLGQAPIIAFRETFWSLSRFA